MAKGELPGGGTQYDEPLLKVEITRLFIPGASLTESYCTTDQACGCATAPPPEDESSPEYSGDSSTPGGGSDCNHTWIYNGSTDPVCVFDPNIVPDWFLAYLEARACDPHLTTLAWLCNPIKCFRLHGPPTGPVFPAGGQCAAFYSEWLYVLNLWRLAGEYYTLQKCGLIPNDGSTTPPGDEIHVEKLKVQFPAGTKILSTACIIMTIDEACDLCAS